MITRNISRRVFIGKAGTAAAVYSFLPVSALPLASGAVLPEKAAGQQGIAAKTIEISVAEQEAQWWAKEPLRIIEFEEGCDFGKKFDLLKELGANMEHATRFTDTSPGTSFLDAHNLFSGKKVNFSSLDGYLSEAHKRGIRVVIYYNVHAIEINYARKHPEWQQIKDDGTPIEDVYSVDSSFCINSPWREEVFRILDKLAGYGIDGIFYDGPIFFASTCHCSSCKKLFRERYNRELPSKENSSSTPDSTEWADLVEFQSDSIADFLRESNRILKAKNQAIMFYMNGNTLAPSWPTGRDNRKIIRETDILGAEGGFLYGELREPVYKPGAMARLLETQSGGKPTVVFDAAKQGPWAFSTLPAGEISLLYSQTITNQANVWLAVSAVSNLHDDETGIIKRYNRFISDNPDPFFKTKSLAKTALVWPQNSGNYYSGTPVPLTDFTKEVKNEKGGNTMEEFYGFYDGLARSHCPFDVLDEKALESDISVYDLIIFPNVTCLSPEASAKIRSYVQTGGNIISSFETSRYNQHGKRLDDFELNDVYGLKSAGDIFGPLRWDYLSPTGSQHFSLREIKNKFLNAPSYGLKVLSDGKTPLLFCKPLPGSYSGSPEVSEYPFMVENEYGNGKSVYLAGTFGGSLYRYHFPEYYRILLNLVSEMSELPVKLENAPSSVEISIRKKASTIFLYLINFTSEMKRPIKRIIPCSNIGAEVVINCDVSKVTALWSATELEFTRKKNSISFKLPLLEDYEVVRIDQ